MYEDNEVYRRRVKYQGYWIGFGICFFINFLIAGSVLLTWIYGWGYDMKTHGLRNLCDAFSTSGLLMLCYYVLIWVSGEGAFDAITYSIKLVYNLTFHPKTKDVRMPKNYADYRAIRLSSKKKPLSFVALSGGIYLIVGIILMIILYAKG